MYQFFVQDDQVGRNFITLTGGDVHHIKHVLRMAPGEIVRVSSAGGRDFICRVSEVADAFVQLDILESDAAGSELPNRIYLFQALPKGERMEYVIQKAVELGVFEIIPVAMKYCVVKLDEKRAQSKARRWQAIAESAAKQSKRSLIPSVHPVLSFAEAVSYAKACDRCIVPYENERGMRATADVLASIRPGERVSLMIGPEGGFAPEEIDAVRQQQMQVISLGKRILRTDTAAITAMSMLMLHLEMKEQENGNLFG